MALRGGAGSVIMMKVYKEPLLRWDPVPPRNFLQEEYNPAKLSRRRKNPLCPGLSWG